MRELILVIAAAWACLLCWKDCTEEHLPKTLTILPALGFLGLRFLAGGPWMALSGLLGGGLAGAFLLVPFLMRGAGGGDVKMLATAGTLVGWEGVLPMLMIIAMVGLVLAIAMMLLRKPNLAHLRHLCHSLFDPNYDRREQAKKLGLCRAKDVKVPFSLAIGIGLVTVLVLN